MNRLRILVIEDSAADAELALRSFTKEGITFHSERVEQARELKIALNDSDWDVVLSDYNLPGFGAYEALKILKEIKPNVPFILVSSAIGEETAVDLIKSGAADFVMKSKLSRLPMVVNRAVREALSQKKEDQAVREKNQVLSVVSHDLKNPLAAVDLNLQLMDRLLNQPYTQDTLVTRDKQIQAQVTRARKSAQRMKNLITDILDQTRIESGRFQVQIKRERAEDLVFEVIEMFQPMALQKSVTIESILPHEECSGDFDYERIFQVLANLVGNALKFTEPHGKIKISIHLSPTDLELRVQDSGPGIAPEHQRRIFERYWQVGENARQGVGLGLSIAKGIVDVHKGKISVESVLGQGSTFKFTLPRWNTAPCDAGLSAWSPPLSNKIALAPLLLIDDDEELSEVFAQVLIENGYRVDCLKDAESAIKFLSTTPTIPSLIILDYSLPGMNGAQFSKWLREQPSTIKNIPIILSSGERDIEEKSKFLPVQAILKKPATLVEVLRVIKKFFDDSAS